MAKPYQIDLSSAEVEKLYKKLELASFPDEIESEDRWAYGAPLADVRRLAAYWRDGFDLQGTFSKLNDLPNFRTEVFVEGFGDIGIHFLHQRSSTDGAVPLLFCHGWCGSFIEVTKILPMLQNGDEKTPAFHVVAPSLPNFGFSYGIKKPGFGLGQYAETCHKLMLSLGYTEYVTQGGDWGAYITRTIGLLYPDHCKASHLNFIVPSFPGIWTPVLAIKSILALLTGADREKLQRTQTNYHVGGGYIRIQSTKPQTLGYGLTDSPVALLAWMYEKLRAWTDGYPWTDEEILTWVSIYYFSTAGPAASIRIYYEVVHPESKTTPTERRLSQWIPRVKLGLSYFPKEVFTFPKAWSQVLGPVAFTREHDSGGHFAAWEKPDALAGDLRDMFSKSGPCYGIIKGNDGY